MTNIHKRLQEIINEMSLIEVESINKKMSMEKKMQYYRQSNLLVNEAVSIINELERKISNLDEFAADNVQVPSVENLTRLLSDKKATFAEVSFVIGQLLAAEKNIPKHSEIIDNVEKQAIYEEYDIQY